MKATLGRLKGRGVDEAPDMQWEMDDEEFSSRLLQDTLLRTVAVFFQVAGQTMRKKEIIHTCLWYTYASLPNHHERWITFGETPGERVSTTVY